MDQGWNADEAVSRFGAHLKAKGKQPATVESYCRDARRFLDYLQGHRLPLKSVEAETLLAYQEHLREAQEERGNSIRRSVIGIRQFFRYLCESGAVADSPFDMVAIPARDDRLPKGLEEDDVDALIAVAAESQPPVKGIRDAAMVALLGFEGLKASELIALGWNDFLDMGSAPRLRVTGAKARTIYLGEPAGTWLREWRSVYRRSLEPVFGAGTGRRMFVAFKGRDAASPLPVMTRHGLKFALYELGDKAGLNRLNTEQLRHFAVAHLIALGRSPEEIMTHLGLRRIGNIAKHFARSDAAAPKPEGEPPASDALT